MLRFLFKPFRILFSPKRLFLTFVSISFVTAVYCVYLDYLVQQKFEGKRFSLPARVYARPLELYVGKSLSRKALAWELGLLRYSKVDMPRGTGQFSQKGNKFYLYTKPFMYWDGEQASQFIEIKFRNGLISSIRDVNSAAELNLVRIEPLLIGGIYPDKNEDRDLVRYEQLPRNFVDALIAVEDQRFYFHYGVDPKALLRAFVSTISGKGVQGGSTITQQLVKNFYLSPERTLWRKFNEMLMALLLERRYEKNDILETYVNEVYFGQDRTRAIHGVALASQFYFGRDVKQMELQQAALLVAMLKGPAVYNPRRYPDRAMSRRNLVLAELYRQGFISEREYKRVKVKPLGLSVAKSIGASRYPAFIDLVFRQLRQDYKESDLRSEGLKIFTTLDPYVQNVAEDALQKHLSQFEKNKGLKKGVLEGSVVMSSAQTGEVQAVVGGRRVAYEGFNRALDAKRQVGSLIKPAIYLTALENPLSYSLSTLLDDSPLVWESPGADVWKPNNYDKQFHGEIPLWYALAKSYNVASVRLGLQLGIDEVVSTAHRLGVDSTIPPYASSLLGAAQLSPMDMAQMYQTLASGGFRIPLRAIREVLTQNGTPLKRYGLEVEQVTSSDIAYLINFALKKVVSDGTGKQLSKDLAIEVAGKTGTTDNFRDSWFAGFSGDKVGVVWVGSDNNVNTHLTGAGGALKIWSNIFSLVAKDSMENPVPQEMVTVVTDRQTGARVRENCGGTIALPFVEGTEPLTFAKCSQKQNGEGKMKKWWRRMFGKR